MTGLIQLLCRRIESGGLAALTPAERQVFAINWLLVETNIGGLHQFFFNDTGKFTADALAGLNAIGAAETLEVFQNAVQLFPSARVPVDQTERRAALAALPPEVQWEYFGELTAQLFRVSENISQRVADYIAANPHLFPALQMKL